MGIDIKKLSIVLLCIVAIMVALSLSGCSGRDSGGLPATKYVAIHETLDEGFTIIEGDTGLIRPMTNPPGVFDVDGSRGLLPDTIVFNRSLKVLYGTSHFSYSVLNRQLTGFDVTGIYSLPYGVDINLSVLDVDQNGTVHFSFQNESFYLKVGDHWTSPLISSRIEVTDFNSSVTDYTKGPTPVTMPVRISFTTRYDQTIMLENMGVFDKSGVKKK